MPADSTWIVTNTKFDAHSLGQHNSVFTIANGYLGIKGNLAEDRDGYRPVTLVNGVYDELDMFGTIRPSNRERRYLDPRYFDDAGRSPAVANLPNPLLVRVFVGDREVSLTRGEVSEFRQTLALDSGTYAYTFTYRDALGRSTRIQMLRFASMRHPHRVFMRYAVMPVDHDAPFRLLSGIDGSIRSNTTGERQYRVTEVRFDPPDQCRLDARTNTRGIDVHVAVAHACRGGRKEARTRLSAAHDHVHTEFELESEAGQPIVMDRFIAVATSEDTRHGIETDVNSELSQAIGQSFEVAQDEQRAAWADLWARADVQIEGDPRSQRDLRTCIYHLLASAPWHSSKLSVPVKLLSGEYYQGNTFYDTDLYIVPFYLLTFPELARHCVDWRCLGIESGRRIARKLGYAGTKLAWQAGPYGEECLGNWYRFTKTNIHINADAAATSMRYSWATGDTPFMDQRGIDLLVETARFYASRAEYDPQRDAYDLHEVTGPDEGHCGVTNDFYTNDLAARNLQWAAERLANLRARDPQAYDACATRLDLREDEPERWTHVAARLTRLFDPETKIYEQCEGFYQLEPIPPTFSENRDTWFETVFPYQALNQPDVVMTLMLFRDAFADDVRRANWEFYRDKSMNFSSMSFAPNAIVAADVGDLDEAYRNFRISAGMDLDESLTGRRDTHEGLHGTAAGGAWMAAIFGFGGVHLSEEGLRINPNLPPKWKSLQFNLAYRGEFLNVAIEPHEAVVTRTGQRPLPAGRANPLTLTIAGRQTTLAPGEPIRVPTTAS
jgi:kojibiose phosphorylase